MRRATPTILFLALAAVVLAPAAEAGPFYLLAKLGSTDTGINVGQGFDRVLDGDDNSSSFGLGLKLGRHAFQIEYNDLGKVPGLGAACPFEGPSCVPAGLSLEADSSALSITFLPHLLLTKRIRLYGKLGVVSWDSDISVVGDLAGNFLETRKEEDLVYGAGLRLQIPGPFGAFAEYERIADAFDTVAIGATWGF